jgi:putative endopeptidase
MGGPVGYCIFHEIGHALDTIDLGIDKFGQPIEGSLIDAGDVDEYERRVQKAKDYYDSIVAYKGQNVVGEVCLNEGLNEISAMQARLAYAAHQEGFDYKEFFEVHARRARCLRTPELEQQCILGADTHPSAYLDINGSTQQFDEFYETYGAKEGDGMYLAPEARVALW